MAKYRKKPIIIDAIHISQLFYLVENDFWKMPDWVIKAYDDCKLVFGVNPSKLYIKTSDSERVGDFRDMLIKDIDGELYPCKPEIFTQTYEYVED